MEEAPSWLETYSGLHDDDEDDDHDDDDGHDEDDDHDDVQGMFFYESVPNFHNPSRIGHIAQESSESPGRHFSNCSG